MKQILNYIAYLTKDNDDYDAIAMQKFHFLNELKVVQNVEMNFLERSIYEFISFRIVLERYISFRAFANHFHTKERYEQFIGLLKQWNEDYLLIKFLQINYILCENNYWENKKLPMDEVEKIDAILHTINEREFFWELGEKLGKELVK